MRLSYAWLQSYFSDPLPSPAELAALLTMHSFEIEGMRQVETDTIFEMKTLANRAHDCLGHYGVAKDIALLLDRPLARMPLLAGTSAWGESKKLSVVFREPALCKRYCALVMQELSVGESPAWLKERLRVLGQKPINTVVDALNYVMFDIGQPMHAFDRNALAEHDGAVKIAVRRAKDGEHIKTLGGADHALTSDMLLIVDGTADMPLGIAGVKGGVRAEITSKTKNIVIESANFDPVSVRRTALQLRLRTDASVRFEHELSPDLAYPALLAAAELIRKNAGGEMVRVEGMVDEYPDPHEAQSITVSLSYVRSVLGAPVPAATCEKILRMLSEGFEADGETYTVTPPFERLDLLAAEDLAEEVGRIYGYEHIAAQKLPAWKRKVSNRNMRGEMFLRQELVNLGFSEVYTYAFTNAGDVALENPIAEDKRFLRKNLRAGLHASLDMNAKNAPLLGVDIIRLFEIGTVFTSAGEKRMVAFGIRRAGKQKKDATETELAQMKKMLEERTGALLDGTTEGGVFEADVADAIARMNPSPIRLIQTERRRPIIYKKLSPYPFIDRDIAVFVPAGTGTDAVRRVIEKEAGEFLVGMRLFDTFAKDDNVSYAFRLVFQSQERTLTDTEIALVMKRITNALEGNREWKVR